MQRAHLPVLHYAYIERQDRGQSGKYQLGYRTEQASMEKTTDN